MLRARVAMTVRPRVTVVGAGVSGLAVAYYLRRVEQARRPEVVVVEGSARLGGKVLTREECGVAVDVGPDSLVLRSAQMRDLVDELGLAGALVPPAVSGAYVYARGRLRALPPGSLFGLPERLLPLLRSGIVSPSGSCPGERGSCAAASVGGS